MSAAPQPEPPSTAEHRRLAASSGDLAPWRIWGPYLSGRQWGTVREDYSADGDAWASFPFDQAHVRAYRWGEDGIAGLTDRYGFLNIALACWNGRDDRLKERLFGLTNAQGNHGEDAKEYWWHLDATPTHSWAQYLYRYPQAAFPYDELVAGNAARGLDDDELELTDTGVLDENRFFDVVVTHAKADPFDVVVQVEATNHGPDPAPLDLLPQVWFRNTWSWGRDDRRPELVHRDGRLLLRHDWLGSYEVTFSDRARVLLCDNETDTQAAFGTDEGQARWPTSAIDRAVVHGDESLLAPDDAVVTKAALWWHHDAVVPGESVTVSLRLRRVPGGHPETDGTSPDGTSTGSSEVGQSDSEPVDAAAVLADRRREADEFYAAVVPAGADEADRLTARRAFAGLLWCKQLYRYDVRQWLEGDPTQPTPPPQRRAPQPSGRNTSWTTLSLADVISMPDEWEYPWFATWDLAFHAVALAHIDPELAKEQLLLLCREWAMSPDGQLPAYEWNFSDVNPPVHAWAAWQVYELDGRRDTAFLVRIVSKLLLSFGWWVNRKDPDGSHLFEGGFLGMDNIGPFDRSEPLPDGQRLEQSDATSWMAFFCLSMLRICWELARTDRAWDDLATKFLEHFLLIADALESFGSHGISLWNEEDGFFYDAVVDADGEATQVRVRSLVGLLPLMAVACEPDWVPGELADYTRRMGWLLERRPELTDGLVHGTGDGASTTLSVVPRDRLERLARVLLDEAEFLSPYGIRSLSAAHRGGTCVPLPGGDLPIGYEPAESRSRLFGGNSNWRGPVWFPVNVLLADALRTHGAGAWGDLRVEVPTGSGRLGSLGEAADELDRRLVALFRPGDDGRRPGDPVHVPTGPLWQAHPTFSEYFHGDTGRGLGASHQTGWTACVAHLICRRSATPGG